MATSPAPIPTQRRRRANPPRAHRDPPRAARGAKANRHTRASSSTAHSTATANPPASWGAKRARSTAPGSGRRSCARDWANLGGEGPAGLIADLLASSDVADYVRFRAVCRSWRRCSPDVPRGAAGPDGGRFLPRQWIMLDQARARARPGRYRFLNVSTGECVLTDLPELSGHNLLAVTPEGLLLLLHEPTLVVRLLNPLTRQLTDLPRLHELLKSRGYASARNLQVYGVGLVAGVSAVAVCFFSDPMVLAVAKAGDESWTVVHKGRMISTLPFAGRFYCVVFDRGLMVLDMSSSDQQQQPPRLRMVADRLKESHLSQISYGLHLVDNGGELMLVHRAQCRGGNYNYRYKVYRVDLDAGILIPAKKQGLNGRAVFIGMSRTISVSAGVFPSVRANTIYLAPECDGQTLGYNVTNGWREPCRYYDPFCPPRAVDCLSYCIEGMGWRLAYRYQKPGAGTMHV